MDTPHFIVLLCGIHALGFAVFHTQFWRIFRWKTELAKLSAPNRAIMQIFNFRIIYLASFLAFVCFFYPDDLLQTRLGSVFLGGFSLFWFGRFLEQFIFFGKTQPLDGTRADGAFSAGSSAVRAAAFFCK